MSRLVADFAKINSYFARFFDKVVLYPPTESTGNLGSHEPKALFDTAKVIGDVGGGKKPYAVFASIDTGGKAYVGLDLDADELNAAPSNIYSETRVMDIRAPDQDLTEYFDLIVCRSTLEHVKDTEAAITGLSNMLAQNGKLYMKLPCRRAIFAQLNLRLPNEFKRSMMHKFFPHKSGGGFPAYYDHCTPSAIQEIAHQQGLDMIADRRIYRSSYFGFFIPFYILWRVVMTAQYLLDKDYCESFEMVFQKSN